MVPVYNRDKTTFHGFIMFTDYDEDQIRVIMPGATQLLMSPQDMMDRARSANDEFVIQFDQEFLTSQRLTDCGAEFLTVVWTTESPLRDLLTLPREIFQTVPEALGYCRAASKRN